MSLDFITKAINFDRQVVRNTPILTLSVDEFDDLIDDSFDREFAHRFVRDNDRLAVERVQYHAIDYVFTCSQLRPSRFNDGSFPAWYASLDQLTTFYETSHHWLNYVLRSIDLVSKKNIIQERTLFNVNCNSILLDLRNNKQDIPELISKNEDAYKTTRSLGKKLYQQGNPGLYTSSARNETGENIVIYNKQVLSNANFLNDVIYEYNPSNSKIIVKDFKTDKFLVEM